jgi:hypothetical protein
MFISKFTNTPLSPPLGDSMFPTRETIPDVEHWSGKFPKDGKDDSYIADTEIADFHEVCLLVELLYALQ